MLRQVLLFAVLVFSAFGVAAQTTTPPPQPRPSPPAQPPPTQPPRVVPMVQPAGMRRLGPSFPLNPVAESDRLTARVVHLQRVVAPLYRKPSGKELDAIAPSREIVYKYQDFLRSPNTGIFRLVPDAGCALGTRVVSAKEDCLKYSMPGAGNSFSFRTENYRIRHLADITYEAAALNVTGVFMHGFLTSLGDVPVEGVTLASPGMKFIAEFKPSTSVGDVTAIDDSFRLGINVGEFRYAMSVPVSPDTTYAFRGVAYRGKLVRSADGFRYNELDYDDREDVIVTFRIVDKSEDGSITIIWKLLSESQPPKIKIPDVKGGGESAGNGS